MPTGTDANALAIPSGAIARVTAYVVIDLRDFNASVKLQPPALG